MSTTSVAREAFDSFFSGSHQKCGQLLEQIGSFKGSPDVKVSHNALVNEYYKSGCASPQKLLADLTQALEKARERDKKDKGRRKRDDDDEDGYREDEDLSVLRYNQALLCIQLRQHAQAGHILEELFENIEPIDDFLAIKICFLLLELCLLQREPEQGVTVLAYLEKPNAFLTVLRSERPASKPLAAPAEESAADGEEAPKEKPGPGEAEEGAEDGADQGAADAAEALGDADPLRALEARGGAPPPAEAAAEGPLPSLAVGAFLPRHGRAPDTISRAEYRFMCLMYRARLSVALRNSRAARKEVKSAVEVLEQDLRHAPLLTPHPHTTGTAAGGSQAESKLCQALHSQHQAMVNVLKAYLEYTKQNVRKAIKLLTLTQFNFAEGSQPGRALRPAGEEEDGEEPALSDFHPAQDEACSAVFFNNLGCIHFMMQKPNLALLYFQKALQAGVGAPWSEIMAFVCSQKGRASLMLR
ncbi:unnamed protein product [Prorocentrum cordatum]|uniref:CCR4-NOT transcription complex subunit 10 n=1 Tax=Prorocentrum cordatum TaxID=2364126 RepID=A0ABN9SIN7_9DINO|nr:unnamed protein product [Polarella glacialis]